MVTIQISSNSLAHPWAPFDAKVEASWTTIYAGPISAARAREIAERLTPWHRNLRVLREGRSHYAIYQHHPVMRDKGLHTQAILAELGDFQ